MEQTNTIVTFKTQFESLTSNFLNEYMKLESRYCESMKEHSQKILEQQQTNTSLTELLQTKEQTIKSLQCKLNDKTSLPEETTENKFDIIRGQAKEIAAKDKEIMRLTKELVKLKESKEIVTNIKEVGGWSPTSNPTPKKDPPLLSELTEGDGEEFFEISYRKKKYYRDSKNKVYEIVDEDEVGDCIGDWVKQENGKFKVVKP